MNELNHYEETTAHPYSATSGVLDKKGAVILIVTLVIALALIVTGVVLLTMENSGNSLTLGQTTNVYTAKGERYSYSFAANTTGEHYLYIDNASLFSINRSYTSVSATGTTFDGIYKIYLTKGERVSFTVTAQSTSMKLKVSQLYK